jgi:hypothetical protein
MSGTTRQQLQSMSKRSDAHYVSELFNKLDVGLLEVELAARNVPANVIEHIITSEPNVLRQAAVANKWDLAEIHDAVVARAREAAKRRAAEEAKPRQRVPRKESE